MELLSKQDFEGKDFGPNLSGMEVLTIVANAILVKQDKKLEKQRMMGTFDSKKEETVVYQSVSTKQETGIAEKNASNKPLVVTSKKQKPIKMEPEKTRGANSGYVQVQMGTLKSKKQSNCVVEKEPDPFIPKKPRGWQPQKENSNRERKDMTFKKNGLKRKFQDEHEGDGKKLKPNTTGDLLQERKEFKKETETLKEFEMKLKTEKKMSKSSGVNNDADDHEWDSECELRKKKHRGSKKRQNQEVIPNSATTSHDLPEDFKKKIETLGGTKVNLVIEKRLTKSDLLSGENRLNMPFRQIRSKFLEVDEAKRLENKETLTGIPLIDTRLQEREICLRQWSMATSEWYVLKTQWYKTIVVENELREGELIQVWSFRDKANNLHLALVLVDEREGEISDAAGYGNNGLPLLGESSCANSGGSSV